MGACSRKYLWIFESKTQCSIASHGNSADGAGGARAEQAKAFFHLRNEVADEEIFVPRISTPGVDVKAGICLRSDDHELANLLSLLKVLDDVPCAAGDEEGMVAAQPMQKIDSSEFLVGLSIVARRKKCAEAGSVRKITAFYGAAFHASSGKRGKRAQQQTEVEK